MLSAGTARRGVGPFFPDGSWHHDTTAAGATAAMVRGYKGGGTGTIHERAVVRHRSPLGVAVERSGVNNSGKHRCLFLAQKKQKDEHDEK